MPNGEDTYLPQSGASLGDQGDEVQRLQDYLRRFGYLEGPDDAYAPLRSAARAPRAEDGTFDEATLVGLRHFQRFAGLPVTGELDDATIAQMSRPRCGFPDRPVGGVPAAPSSAGEQVSSFVAQGNRWPTSNLSYGFQEITQDLPANTVRAAIVAAFNLWAQAAPLTFTESPNPQIVIRFVTGNHGDGSPFDGPGAVLAHAFYPPPNGGDIAGDTHFDDAETWTVALPVPAGGFDLVTVAAHEFGHALGLAHSDDPAALMYPFYSGPHRHLAADDSLGIQTIYGSNLRVVPGWFGNEDQGADIAVADINGNGRPDLVVFHVDNPGGANHGYYRVGRDLNAAGNVTGGWTDVKPVPGWFGNESQGAGIACADINGNGRPDLVVFHVDNPAGANHGWYRIGRDVDASGNVTGGWTDIKPVPGWFGNEDQGAGIAVADISGNGRPDLVVFHLDNPRGENHGWYRIGWNLDQNGNVTGGWGPIVSVPGWFGWEDQGAGIAVADVNNSGRPDLVVFHVDNPAGENHGWYRIGWNLDTAGNVTGGWGPIVAVPGWFGAEDQGAGIALADVNGNGRQELLVFHVDNPGGENHGWYRVISDL